MLTLLWSTQPLQEVQIEGACERYGLNKPFFASLLGTHGAGGCWSGLFRYSNLYSQSRTLVFPWADFGYLWFPLLYKFRVRLCTKGQVEGFHGHWQVQSEGFNRDGHRQLKRWKWRRWNHAAGGFELRLYLGQTLCFICSGPLLPDGASAFRCWTGEGPQWRKWAGAFDPEALDK